MKLRYRKSYTALSALILAFTLGTGLPDALAAGKSLNQSNQKTGTEKPQATGTPATMQDGYALLTQGKYDAAAKVFSSLAARSPEDFMAAQYLDYAQLQTGLTQIRLHKFVSATSTFASIIKRNPNSVHARRYLAFSLIQTGELKQAIIQLQFTESLKKKTAFDSFLLGTAYELGAQSKDAVVYFMDAVQADPGNDFYRLKAIDTLRGLALYAKASALSQTGVQLATSEEIKQKYYTRMNQIVSAERLANATRHCRTEKASAEAN